MDGFRVVRFIQKISQDAGWWHDHHFTLRFAGIEGEGCTSGRVMMVMAYWLSFAMVNMTPKTDRGTFIHSSIKTKDIKIVGIIRGI